MTDETETRKDGCMLALVAVGQQDAYCDKDNDYYNARDALMNSPGKSISCYRKLDYDFSEGTTTRSGTKCSYWQFSIKPTCTFVNELDIAFSNSDASFSVVSFDTEVGGQRIDRIGHPDGSHADFMTDLSASCAMFGVQTPNYETFPVCMAPFYRFNAMSKSLIEHHQLIIRVHFSCTISSYVKKPPALMGMCHFVVPGHDIYKIKSLEFNTIQHQMMNSPEGLSKKNMKRWDDGETFAELRFNHPVYAIYFWGHDPNVDYRVSLTLNSIDIFVEPIPISALRHRAKSKGLVLESGVEVIMFADSLDFSKRLNGLINFSRIDDAELILLDGPKCEKLHVVALNLQPLRIMEGMCGLAFSK